MNKFGRRYKITIQTTDITALVIEPPLTVEFDIHRSVMATMNSMTLRIYNLSETKQNLIYQDRFDINKYKIIVEAGYESLSTVFIGDIFEANSTREGSNIITKIDARDGSFDMNQSVVNTTLKAGTTLNETLTYLAGQFKNLKGLHVTNATPGMEDAFERPVVLEGNVYELIKQYALQGGVNDVYIDLDVIYINGQNEVVVNGEIELLDASTGLIHTPRRDQSFLTVTTIFEPRVIMGQVIQLVSDIQPKYNGLYKIIGLKHQGVISEAVGGPLESQFNMVGNQILGGFVYR